MLTTAQLLDAAKAQSGIASDYKLATVLQLSSHSAVSNYRKGRSIPDDAITERLAELAGLDVHYALACIHAERAKGTHTAAVWRGLADRLAKAGTAAAVAVVALGITGTPDAHASQSAGAPMARVCALC